jgi:mxaK protein
MAMLRSLKGPALIAAFCVVLLGVCITVALGVRAALANQTLAALQAGHDKSIRTSAPFEVKFARAMFLLDHDRLDDAQAWVDAISAAGPPHSRAQLYYNLANARLRAAFAQIEHSQIDAAASNVRLAKAGYRKALTLEPQFWNAKYNLDVAMRLVRDFPQMEAEVLEKPPQELPKRLWTDMPRLPRGLP